MLRGERERAVWIRGSIGGRNACASSERSSHMPCFDLLARHSLSKHSASETSVTLGVLHVLRANLSPLNLDAIADCDLISNRRNPCQSQSLLQIMNTTAIVVKHYRSSIDVRPQLNQRRTESQASHKSCLSSFLLIQNLQGLSPSWSLSSLLLSIPLSICFSNLSIHAVHSSLTIVADYYPNV